MNGLRLSFVFLFSILTVQFAAPLRADDTTEFVEVIVDLLSESDKEMRSLGLEQVRTAQPGAAATKGFAAALPKLSEEAQIGLLKALGARGDAAAKEGIGELLTSSKSTDVRVAAIGALGNLGGAEDLPAILKFLARGEEAEKGSARSSLIRLRGETVSKLIAEAYDDYYSPTVKIAIVEILTERRAMETIPKILEAAVSNIDSVRTVAMVSLGKIAGPEHIAGMVEGVLKAEKGRERTAAEKQVMFVSARIEDPAKRALPLLWAVREYPVPQKLELLSTLGRVGGPLARKVIEAAITSNDTELNDLGIEAICNWPDATIAPRLLELATFNTNDTYRAAALRALMRVAPLRDDRSDEDRLALLVKAMSMTSTTRDAEFALDRARTIRTIESLRFVERYIDKANLKEQACLSVVELAHDRTLRVPNQKEFDKALDKVIAVSKDAVVVDRAQRYKIDETWVRPKK